MYRRVVWFSCGAASAVTAKLAIDEDPNTIVVRCVVANEHPDNDRFADDVQRWLKTEIINLRSDRYADCWEVWEKRRYLNGPAGAACTVQMKKAVRQEFEMLNDVQFFGFTVGEMDRAKRFVENNPEVIARFPLIEQCFTKSDCYEYIQRAGLSLPEMYRLGYHNANCIGCVKGGAGYWNKIRVDFPEVFERMAQLEEKLGATVLNGKSLRELRPGEGRHEDLLLPECGLFCGQNDIRRTKKEE